MAKKQYDTELYLARFAKDYKEDTVIIRFLVDFVKPFHRLQLQEYYAGGWQPIQTNKRPNRKEIDWELDAKIKTFRAIGYSEYAKENFSSLVKK